MHQWTLGNCARGTKKTDTQVVPAKAHVSKNEWSCCSLEENTFRNLCRRKPHFKSSEGFHFCVRGSGSIDNRLFQKTTTNSELSTSCSYLSQFYPKAPPGPVQPHSVQRTTQHMWEPTLMLAWKPDESDCGASYMSVKCWRQRRKPQLCLPISLIAPKHIHQILLSLSSE